MRLALRCPWSTNRMVRGGGAVGWGAGRVHATACSYRLRGAVGGEETLHVVRHRVTNTKADA